MSCLLPIRKNQWEALGEDPDAGWSVVTKKRKAKQPAAAKAPEEGEGEGAGAAAGEEGGSGGSP